ncbi:MAG TPA: hypothetical protein VEH31_04400, partial [Streptosporangiaceae bacterium]|nr:hypothetical protein [Streptosporangiaceae bacterium]
MTAGNPPAAVLVAGVGRPDRGDDAVGPAVAGRAMGLVPPGVTVVERVEPAGLIDAWAGADLVVVTDAVRSGRRPGTVHVLHACGGPLPVGTG